MKLKKSKLVEQLGTIGRVVRAADKIARDARDERLGNVTETEEVEPGVFAPLSLRERYDANVGHTLQQAFTTIEDAIKTPKGYRRRKR